MTAVAAWLILAVLIGSAVMVHGKLTQMLRNQVFIAQQIEKLLGDEFMHDDTKRQLLVFLQRANEGRIGSLRVMTHRQFDYARQADELDKEIF